MARTMPTAPRSNEAYRPPDRLFRYAADGTAIDSVGWGAGREIFAYGIGSAVLAGAPHFGRSTLYVVRDSLFYVGTNDTYEIKVYSTTGALRTIVRKQHENLSVTTEDIDVLQEERRESLARAPPNIRENARRMFEEMPFPETMPAFGRSGSSARTFHVDALGNVWVMEYNRPGDDSKRWTVFDSDGMLLGTLRVPDDLVISNIGPDYVLGVHRDEDDVEHVRLYELVKPAS